MKTIWKREVRSYYHTPYGYVFTGVFLLLASLLFYMMILAQRSSDLPTFVGLMSYLWMLLSPVLTMHLLAGERQKGTDRLLMTSPASVSGIVLGKYLAAVTVLLGTVILTLAFVGVVALYGQVYPAELGVCYLGFLLQGCAFLALDLFLSGCVASPVTAAILSFGANFLIWILDLLAGSELPGWMGGIGAFLSLYSRNEAFLMGQLSFAGIIYDLSFIAAFLTLTVYRMNRRRFKGAK